MYILQERLKLSGPHAPLPHPLYGDNWGVYPPPWHWGWVEYIYVIPVGYYSKLVILYQFNLFRDTLYPNFKHTCVGSPWDTLYPNYNTYVLDPYGYNSEHSSPWLVPYRYDFHWNCFRDIITPTTPWRDIFMDDLNQWPTWAPPGCLFWGRRLIYWGICTPPIAPSGANSIWILIPPHRGVISENPQSPAIWGVTLTN